MATLTDYPRLRSLHNETCWLRLKWRSFERIGEEGGKEYSVLTDDLSKFFDVIWRCLWRDVALSICRLVEQGSGKETMASVLESVKKHMQNETYDELRVELGELRDDERMKKVRDGRGSSIAHLSREVAMGLKDAPGVQPVHVGELVELVSDWELRLCNAVGVNEGFNEAQLELSIDTLWLRLALER